MKTTKNWQDQEVRALPSDVDVPHWTSQSEPESELLCNIIQSRSEFVKQLAEAIARELAVLDEEDARKGYTITVRLENKRPMDSTGGAS
jgi:hypothetical protein